MRTFFSVKKTEERIEHTYRVGYCFDRGIVLLYFFIFQKYCYSVIACSSSSQHQKATVQFDYIHSSFRRQKVAKSDKKCQKEPKRGTRGTKVNIEKQKFSSLEFLSLIFTYHVYMLSTLNQEGKRKFMKEYHLR